MANKTSENGKTGEGAVYRPPAALPERIARLINPVVRAERAALLEAGLRDEALHRVRRRRYAEIITTNLLEKLNG